MKKITTVIAFIMMAVIMVLSIRGIHGNPDNSTLNTPKWKEKGPFELSPERGRFALLYSIVEDKSLIFSLPVARFATPDLGIVDGKYVSLFAPAVSLITAPGYLIGKYFGASQVGAFAIVSLFALINTFFVRIIARHLGANDFASTIAALLFLLATPAYTYGVTLYQHHVSTFLILASFIALLKFRSFIALIIVWFLFSLSIPVDYPNLILMMPLALYSIAKILWIKKEKMGIQISINFKNLITPIVIVLPLIFYIWFSQGSYGKPFQLAGTVTSVPAINSAGKPTSSTDITDKYLEEVLAGTKKDSKSATGFFQTRNLVNGFYIHIFSPDRGTVVYAPIVLFGIAGAFYLWKRKQSELALITGVIGCNVLIYSLWGDPWGGWAFGSRYLIPTYALLAVLIGVALTAYKKVKIFTILFVIAALYSIVVNTLGAVTSSQNPPQVQVLALEQATKREQKYTYARNIDYLTHVGSKSYFYNQYLKSVISPVAFFVILASVISLLFAVLIALLLNKKYE